ncbi:kDa in NOF-FB transposable element, partial [Paramuricea clavata]
MDVPKKASFQLSEEEWNRIKPVPSQPMQLQNSWSDVLASHISRSNAFLKHAAGERQARFVKGDQRKAMIEKFHKGNDKPSMVYQEKKAGLPKDALASGNRTGCGTHPTTDRKIASEGRQLSQMDKDLFTSLHKVQAISREQCNTKKDEEHSDEEEEHDVWYRFSMYSVSLLVNARTLHKFRTILEDIAICLLSKRQTKMLLVSYRRVKGRIKNMNVEREIKLSNFETKPNELDEGKEDLLQVKSNANPFNTFFKNKLSVVVLNVEKDSIQNINKKLKDNRSYCPKFMEFLKSYLPEMALWSGVLLGSLERYKENRVPKTQNPVTKHPFLSCTSANSKTEGYVEGVTRNLKQEDFPGPKYLRADVFVSENYERIRRIIIDYSDRLDSCKQAKPKRLYKRKKKDADDPLPVSTEEYSEDLQKHDYHNAEETWGKRDPETPKTNPRLGQYQQSPKIPLSQDPDLKKKSSKKKRRRGYQDKQIKQTNYAKNVLLSVNSSETDSKDKKFMKFENNLHTSESNDFVGLQNRKNNCWLNSLVQCMNNLPIKNCLLDNVKESSESPLTTALTSALSKIDSLGNHGSFYPKELHNAFQCELQYAPGEQCDIHESFTSLCCSRSGMNEEIGSHFQ